MKITLTKPQSTTGEHRSNERSVFVVGVTDSGKIARTVVAFFWGSGSRRHARVMTKHGFGYGYAHRDDFGALLRALESAGINIIDPPTKTPERAIRETLREVSRAIHPEMVNVRIFGI